MKSHITLEELKQKFDAVYEKALEYENLRIDSGADMLCNVTRTYFDHVKKMTDESQRTELCEFLVKRLYTALEVDGIGAYGDSEWLYMEVCSQIEAYLEERP